MEVYSFLSAITITITKRKQQTIKLFFVYMGHSVRDREMIKVKEEFESKLSKEANNDQHNLLSNMVDARACYKPSERVRK